MHSIPPTLINVSHQRTYTLYYTTGPFHFKALCTIYNATFPEADQMYFMQSSLLEKCLFPTKQAVGEVKLRANNFIYNYVD